MYRICERGGKVVGYSMYTLVLFLVHNLEMEDEGVAKLSEHLLIRR